MSFNVLDLAKGYLTNAVIQKVSGSINEDSSLVSKAISAALPSLLGGILKTSSSESGLSNIMNLITKNSNSSVLDNLGGILSDQHQSSNLMSTGSSMLSGLLGNNLGGILDAVSGHTGIKKESTSSIMSILAPIVMSIIGNKVKSEGLGLSALGSLLGSQKDMISSALPAGLASSLGFGNMFSSAKKVVEPIIEEKSRNWLPIILGALALLAAFLFLRNCKDDVKDAASDMKNATVAAVDSAASATASVVDSSASLLGQGLEKLGSFFKRKLPNGFELNIPEFGVENQLIKFIEDKSALVTKDNWLNFDRINFATGSSELTKESWEQVGNISEILKAYPNVNMKVGGYTDNTGNAQANQKLSADRASNVMKAIISKGIEAKRLTSEGYGDQHPVASNDTEEGKAQNRRIAIRVIKK